MGVYLNPGADLFLEARRDEIYVDKSALIGEIAEICLCEPSAAVRQDNGGEYGLRVL